MSNADALAGLAGLARRLEAVGRVPEQAAPEVARALQRELIAQIARAQDAEGRPWEPTIDGRKPLQGAASALTVTARGPVVVARLQGPEALHSTGRAAGGVRRGILPTKRMPQAAVAAVQAVIVKAARDG